MNVEAISIEPLSPREASGMRSAGRSSRAAARVVVSLAGLGSYASREEISERTDCVEVSSPDL